MEPTTYDKVLELAQQLTPDERERLASELANRQSAAEPAIPRSGGRSALDGFRERRLLGTMTDAPPDLSTNPAHLEGFGEDDR